MCGIVGYVGGKNATEILVEGLRRLEYRGYDSAGAAVLDRGEVRVVRAEGKLKNLEERLRKEPLAGATGIGHTRWATHGRPSETNAHPHRAGPVVLVHNGIIENHARLRDFLKSKGHAMRSETDTEIVCHLISQRLSEGLAMREAFQKVLSEIEGSYALVVLNQNEPDRLYVARKGSPLVVGLGEGEGFVASDVPALLAHTRKVLFLEDLDRGVVTAGRAELWDAAGKAVERPAKHIAWSQAMAEKGGYKHFMLKEIFEQPRAVVDTLSGRISDDQRNIFLEEAERLFAGGRASQWKSAAIVACGTSYHAGLTAKYWIEEFARVPVAVDLASEFRYRNPILGKDDLVIAVSQSGETADTLAALQSAKEKGATVLSICNVVESTIPRASDLSLYTRAGPEIGVASTKAFTTQLTVLLLLALRWGAALGTASPKLLEEAVAALVRLPDEMERLLKSQKAVADVAECYAESGGFLFFGRGPNYPVALEGALKLKEISYIHAEGYAAGEMKHGPIALIDSRMPVVVLAPRDKTYEKILSNVEEVRARGALVIGVGAEGDREFKSKCRDFIGVHETPWYLTPILYTIPLQLLAYHIADHKGTDVDQPRNLAKSVTVE
jgi:glucosamine--fructose-6-phosphate aminotransferase (isomerizing)